jgi:hypothetical protein
MRLSIGDAEVNVKSNPAGRGRPLIRARIGVTERPYSWSSDSKRNETPAVYRPTISHAGM